LIFPFTLNLEKRWKPENAFLEVPLQVPKLVPVQRFRFQFSLPRAFWENWWFSREFSQENSANPQDGGGDRDTPNLVKKIGGRRSFGGSTRTFSRKLWPKQPQKQPQMRFFRNNFSTLTPILMRFSLLYRALNSASFNVSHYVFLYTLTIFKIFQARSDRIFVAFGSRGETQLG
jgi:hypothetical protein